MEVCLVETFERCKFLEVPRADFSQRAQVPAEGCAAAQSDSALLNRPLCYRQKSLNRVGLSSVYRTVC